MWKYEIVEGLEDLEDELAIWIGQVYVKNGTAADEVIKEQAKLLVGRWVWQILCTKIGMYFAPKMRLY
jgi:hypothetical protein